MENVLMHPEPCDLYWEPTMATDSNSTFSLVPFFLLFLVVGFIIGLFILQMKKEKHLLEREC